MIQYQLTRRIGSGGMGDVYKAIEITPAGGRIPVAGKLLKGVLREEKPLISMFREEAEINRRISHGHTGLVALHHWVGTEPEGRDYLIMELVEGCSLRELLDHASHGATMYERLPFDMVRLIARDFLDALAYLHKQGHIHRDISPGNILISQEGAIKLIDLGLARDADGQPLPHFDRKPAYASPEALPGHVYDERSDLYSFGAMLYEMLTGAPPFGERVTTGDLLAREFPDDWHAPPLPDRVPEDLRALAMGLLNPEHRRRKPATASAARDALCAPEGIDETRTRLAQVAKELHQLAHQKRTAEEPGSCAGVRLIALHVSDQRSDEPPARHAPPKRALPHRHVARMLGLALVATAAIGGFALGMYRHNAESAPTPPDTIAATAEEPERVAEPESTEEPTSLEQERKRQSAPTVAESVTVEAPAPMANAEPERARPARMPKRMSRKPSRKAKPAPAATAQPIPPNRARLHGSREIMLDTGR